MFKTMISSIVAKNMQKKLQTATFQEEDLKEVLKQIRTSLLEADVNLLVTKELLKLIKEKALETPIEPTQKPADVFLDLVKKSLVEVLGSETSTIQFDKKPLKIMLVGLQGSGKTTTIAKLAVRARNKFQKNPLLVAGDVYRPAAIEQLVTLANENNLVIYEKGTQNPAQTAKESLDLCKQNNHDMIIFDTAGRLATNVELMNELKQVKNELKPDEIIFVVDAMSGQDIVNVATEFHKNLNLTGIIITKLDSDARAGAALSLRYLLNVPIKFSGVGEKVEQLDLFHPNRIADQILGYGDMISLAEKAVEVIDEKSAKKSFQRMLSGKMDFEDLLTQMEQVSKLGSLSSIVSMLPKSINVSDQQIDKAEAKMRTWKILLNSMTLKEKRNPILLKKNPNRKARIVKGAGRKMDELNKMLSEWEKAKNKMEEIGKILKGGKNPFSKMF